MIELNEPTPILVIEVVNESTKITDHRFKLVEYNFLNIPEYWVVDPLTSKATIFSLVKELYEDAEFVGTEQIFQVFFQS